MAKQNERAYAVALDALERGYQVCVCTRMYHVRVTAYAHQPHATCVSSAQVMVFVHARKDTVRTAEAIRDCAMRYGTLDTFRCDTPQANDHNRNAYDTFAKQVRPCYEWWCTQSVLHQSPHPTMVCIHRSPSRATASCESCS